MLEIDCCKSQDIVWIICRNLDLQTEILSDLHKKNIDRSIAEKWRAHDK